MNTVKKALCILLSALLVITVLPFAVIEVTALSDITYYLDAENGDNSNSGTSPDEAWKDLGGFANEGVILDAGVSVLFRCGGTYDFNVTLEGLCGTEEHPFVISSYGEGQRPVLTTEAYDEVLTLIDCSYITISDLEMVAPNGGGIWIDTINKESVGITIDNVYFHGMPNGTVNNRDDQSNGAAPARAAVMVKGLPAHSRYAVNDLTITNCEVYDCANGFMIWGSWNDEQNPWCTPDKIDPVYNTGLLISDCYFHDMDAEAVIIGICDGALVTNCRAIDTCQGVGLDENGEIQYFTAAMWFWGSVNSTIQYCEIAGQKNYGDGMAVDFDSHTHNCTYQYIYSHDNMRFMCNNAKDDTPQQNNTVRYCLSVNDNGGRSAIASGNGENGLNFYNNTIINCADFHMRHLTNSFVANNIIIPEDGCIILYNLTEELSANNTYENNCYYNTINPVVDALSKNILPNFAGGTDALTAYELVEGSSLIGAGTKVEDGLTLDIFGNEITSSNIGCYGGTGVAATENSVDSENENIFIRLAKFVECVFKILVQEIKELIEDI
ncbi:MAG: hypothetical protein IJC04_10320 [Oscillospiraceae bacterium]|nr:hypothetical protein [Oscillospiraceae bacterium]